VELWKTEKNGCIFTCFIHYRKHFLQATVRKGNELNAKRDFIEMYLNAVESEYTCREMPTSGQLANTPRITVGTKTELWQ